MKIGLAAATGGLVAGLCLPAMAGQLVLELRTEFSGAAYPSGNAPWARATFTDKAGGVVGLTLECLLQDPSEFMAKAAGGTNNPQGWDFNLDPAKDPANLQFTHLTGKTASSIFTGADAFQTGPDRWFDICFQFGSSGLVGGDVVTYDLSLIGGGLTAASFDYITTNGPVGQTGWHTAAHVQGIRNPSQGTGTSGWMGGGKVPVGQPIPLPGAGALALAGMGVIASRRRRVMA